MVDQTVEEEVSKVHVLDSKTWRACFAWSVSLLLVGFEVGMLTISVLALRSTCPVSSNKTHPVTARRTPG